MKWTIEEITFLTKTQDMLSGNVYKEYCEVFGAIRTYQVVSVKKAKLNLCKAECKKLKWTPEMLQCIKEGANLNREEALRQFYLLFGEGVVTPCAFYNQRSRSGISPKKPRCKGTSTRPLYAESMSKNEIRIKVAQPNVWISKTRWVWEETHPGELAEESDNFFFANGDKTDYNPKNIIRVKARERTLFIQAGGVNTDPEITKLNLYNARLKLAQLDLGEKIGIVKAYKHGGRRWK